MLADDQPSALLPVPNFRIARVATFCRRGLGTGGQHELDSGRGRLAVEFDKTDPRDLMRTECRVLRMQVNNLLPDMRRKRPFILLGDFWWRCWWKQRSHTRKKIRQSSLRK